MKTYKILKGCHYSNFIPRFFLLNNITYLDQHGKIRFTDSCKYEIDEKSCVNKLFGYCFGFGVHKNSVRFGWTYNKETNNIYILKYVYDNGKLIKNKIFSCEINEEHDYKIHTFQNGNNYNIEFHIDEKVIERHVLKSNSFFVTTLGPYFGGNSRAPHKIIIEQL